jgi:hypothetical protein
MMNSFGVQRGVVAHTSAKRVQTPPDPQVARTTVANVMSGLATLDPLLVAMRRT